MKLAATVQELEHFQAPWACFNEDCISFAAVVPWSYLQLAEQGTPVCKQCGQAMDVIWPHTLSDKEKS